MLLSKLIPYLLDEYGVLNIGGKKRDIYEFAKKFNNKKVKSITVKKIKNFPLDSSMNIKKLVEIFNRKIKLKNFNF